MKVILRATAAERGLRRYFTGRSCKYGHVSERHTSTGICVQCQNHRNDQRPKVKQRRIVMKP